MIIRIILPIYVNGYYTVQLLTTNSTYDLADYATHGVTNIIKNRSEFDFKNWTGSTFFLRWLRHSQSLRVTTVFVTFLQSSAFGQIDDPNRHRQTLNYKSTV